MFSRKFHFYLLTNKMLRANFICVHISTLRCRLHALQFCARDLLCRRQETAAGYGVRYDAARSLVGVIPAAPIRGEALEPREVLAIAVTLCGVGLAVHKA